MKTSGTAIAFAALAASAIAGVSAFANAGFSVAAIGARIGEASQAAMIAAGFGISQVTLTGQRHAEDAEIFDALDLGNVRAFWQLDAAAALKRIEKIAWVDTAQITRVYPSRMDVEIRERAPAALWTRGDARYLIDATGRVLAPAGEDEGASLPRVAGEGANTEAGALIAALARQPALASRVSTSERIAERRWRIVLRNGARIELGAEREAEGIDQIVQSALIQKVLEGDAVVVDVRTAGRLAVRPLSGAQAQLSAARRP